MSDPIISVVIPTFNGAEHLGKTIQSVLNQTHPDFELILVDDGSVDATLDVIKTFDDPRLKFVNLGENRGADAARNVGIRESTGGIIAFLDQDDLFHPEKLQVHVEYMATHPNIGFTYNARYELNYAAETIREISLPPLKMTLKHIVLSHKLSPSEMVFRKDWAYKVGLLDESHNFHGGEIIFAGRLNLEGCKFANVNRVLNYRRYHAGRIYKNLYGICRDERDAQDKILLDPRCPKSVRALRDMAHVNMYLYFICLALIQNETALGRKLISDAVQLKPDILDGFPCQLIEAFLVNSTDDENQDHELVLENFFRQLPSDLDWLSIQKSWAIARGYFDKGIRAIIWGRQEIGEHYLSRLTELSPKIDESFFQSLSYHLMNYEAEFGPVMTDEVLLKLDPCLKEIGGLSSMLHLRGRFSINRAFRAYRRNRYVGVPGKVLTAVIYEPRYIFNRGALSILFRSILKILSQMVENLYGWITRRNISIIICCLMVMSS